MPAAKGKAAPARFELNAAAVDGVGGVGPATVGVGVGAGAAKALTVSLADPFLVVRAASPPSPGPPYSATPWHRKSNRAAVRLPPAQPPTVTCPSIPGWKVQWYLYVPGVVNCTCHVSPCASVPDVSAG